MKRANDNAGGAGTAKRRANDLDLINHLFEAVRLGDLGRVESAVRNGASVHSKALGSGHSSPHRG